MYFTASTNNGPSDAGIDLSSLDRTVNAGVYVAVLARSSASPIPPESDDENKKKDEESKKADKGDEEADQAGDKKDDAKNDEKKDDKKKNDKKDADKKKAEAKPTVVDLADIGNRILSLPIPSRNYSTLAVGKSGVLFLAEGPPVGRSAEDPGYADPRPVALHHGEAQDRGDLERADGFRRIVRRRKIVLYAAGQLVYRADVRN